MGLLITHGAFEGAYSSFNRFRTNLIASVGGSWPPHSNPELSNRKWYWRLDGQVDDEYNNKNYAGLLELMSHSDCDGQISLNKTKLLKRDLEKILPLVRAYGEKNNDEIFVRQVEQFIDGCEEAIRQKEALKFY